MTLSKFPYSVDGIGTFSLSKFMYPPNQSEIVNFKFHITDVVRQKEKEFKNISSLMRTGTLNSDSCDYFINCSLSIIKKGIFGETIQLVIQCNHSIDPTIDYLSMIFTLIPKRIPQYSIFLLNKGVNHCIK